MSRSFRYFSGPVFSWVAMLAVVFSFSDAYSSSTETVLYAFTDRGHDGSGPTGSLTMDGTGNLYGTTQGGGRRCAGTAFEVATDGTKTTLHCFRDLDGTDPSAGMILAHGKLYGTTWQGGANGYGTVFEIGRHETVLYNFCSQGNCADGASPFASLVADKAGNLYGVTTAGGTSNDGTVFRLAPGGIETVLHSFGGGPDGSGPCGALISDKIGNLFGVTQYGGTNNAGTVFEVSSKGAEAVLYSFEGGTDGSIPCGALLTDKEGNYYGTTYEGGANGKGTVFELSPDGNETILYSFCSRTDCADGSQPTSGVIADGKGNFYGTTLFGDANSSCDCGVVFELTRDGIEKVIHAFSGGSDGEAPESGLILDSAGNLYGTTASGGGGCFTGGCGTVFKITR